MLSLAQPLMPAAGLLKPSILIWAALRKIVVPATPMTWLDVAGEPMVPLVPAVARARDDGDAGLDGGVVHQRDRVVHVVRVWVGAEGLVEHVDAGGDHGVLDRRDEVRGRSAVAVAEDLQPDQARAGRDAADADVAAVRQRVRGAGEVVQVVGLPALRRDRTGVAERLTRRRSVRPDRRR